MNIDDFKKEFSGRYYSVLIKRDRSWGGSLEKNYYLCMREGKLYLFCVYGSENMIYEQSTRYNKSMPINQVGVVYPNTSSETLMGIDKNNNLFLIDFPEKIQEKLSIRKARKLLANYNRSLSARTIKGKNYSIEYDQNSESWKGKPTHFWFTMNEETFDLTLDLDKLSDTDFEKFDYQNENDLLKVLDVAESSMFYIIGEKLQKDSLSKEFLEAALSGIISVYDELDEDNAYAAEVTCISKGFKPTYKTVGEPAEFEWFCFACGEDLDDGFSFEEDSCRCPSCLRLNKLSYPNEEYEW